MRILLNVTIPHEPFNTLVRQGKAGEVLGRILDETKPEAVYFTERGGRRGAVVVVDLPEASKIPALAEPWFLAFNADCELGLAMTPQDLQNAGLDKIGERWG